MLFTSKRIVFSGKRGLFFFTHTFQNTFCAVLYHKNHQGPCLVHTYTFGSPLRCAPSVVTLTRYNRFPVLTVNVNRPVFGHFYSVLDDSLVWYFPLIIFPFSLEGCNHVSVSPLPTSHWTSDAGGTGTDSRLAKVKLFTAHFRQLGQKSFLEKEKKKLDLSCGESFLLWN